MCSPPLPARAPDAGHGFLPAGQVADLAGEPADFPVHPVDEILELDDVPVHGGHLVLEAEVFAAHLLDDGVELLLQQLLNLGVHLRDPLLLLLFEFRHGADVVAQNADVLLKVFDAPARRVMLPSTVSKRFW